MQRNKLIITLICLTLVLALALTACEKPKQPADDNIDDPVQAQGITLPTDTILMVRGSNVQLTYTLSPTGAAGQAGFSTADTRIATINDSGLITAVANGITTVTVRLDDSHYAQCRVFVGDVLVQGAGGTTQPDSGNQGGSQGGGQGSGDQGSGDQGSGDQGSGGQGSGDQGSGDQGRGDQGSGDQGSGGTQPTSSRGIARPVVATQSDNSGGSTGSSQSGNNSQSGGTGNDQSGTGGNQSGGNGQGSQTTPPASLLVGGNKDTTLFHTVQSALTHAAAGSTIIVDSGNYNETLLCNKSVTLIGVRNPVVLSITVSQDVQLDIKNFTFANTTFPTQGTATLHVKSGAKAQIEDCIFSIDNDAQPDGGYGILVDKQSGGITVQKCTFTNYRYGIYVCPTDQTITIKDNKLSNMQYGIGLDIRQPNSQDNYPTKGTIADNEYNEVQQKTQFFHYGENYSGDFSFDDNEEENSSNGNSPSGGQGLQQ